MIVTGLILMIVYNGIIYASDGNCVANTTMSTVLEDIFKDYDKKLPPKWNESGFNRQVMVEVEMFVNSMFDVNEANMEYSMSVFLRERWVDKRLAYNDTLNLSRLILDSSMFNQVWMPDMYILNEKTSHYHEVMIANKFIHIYPDGTVQYSARVTGTFTCRMQLKKYPFDTQLCKFDVESYGHNTENLKFKWGKKAVTTAEGIDFAQFTLTDVNSYGCDKDYYGIMYPCIGVTFILERKYAYHLIQIYVPSILIVILSWVNFWLDCTATPARISLGLLTVLTMTTQSSGALANLPKVSYVKAIDVYMATCLAFVFLGLVEFAYVNVLTRVEIRRQGTNNSERIQDIEDLMRRKFYRPKHDQKTNTTDKQRPIYWCGQILDISPARRIDKISRIAFPFIFLVFNVIYWIYYYTWDVN
ncbi:Glycine receptor subunit alpha-3 [Mactra antiquata]